MRKLILAAAIGAVFLSGCAGTMTIMSRTDGKVYSGVANANGFGSGTLTMTIDGRTYTGPFARTGSSGSFGFYQTYSQGHTAFGLASMAGGHNVGKALLSSEDHHGMRCDIEGDGAGHGGAICQDDQGQIYDAVVIF